jgi:SecD/SecF fusion protein
LYDTVIVFDRVRENAPRMPRATFSQIVNRSMSEVLTRSLATSFCTLLPIISLLIFGGETLKDFAFALLVGVASGAYSSIFIASPLLAILLEREPQFAHRRRELRGAEQAPPKSRAAAAAPAVATADGPAAEDAPAAPRRRRRARPHGRAR